MRTVSSVARVVSILETIAILGSFGKQEDYLEG